jgi:HSP20 family molecular chaperone IbpA
MRVPPRAGDTAPMIAMTPHETGDMMVVTCRVPCARIEELSLAVEGFTVTVKGPDGFRHELELPIDADMDRLGVELYRGVLELRAPRGGVGFANSDGLVLMDESAEEIPTL